MTTVDARLCYNIRHPITAPQRIGQWSLKILHFREPRPQVTRVKISSSITTRRHSNQGNTVASKSRRLLQAHLEIAMSSQICSTSPDKTCNQSMGSPAHIWPTLTALSRFSSEPEKGMEEKREVDHLWWQSPNEKNQNGSNVKT